MKRNKNRSNEENIPFLKFLIRNENKNQLIFFILFYIVLYVLLTFLYPYPASISDSGGYVAAALRNRIDTYRPFGYSRFLIIIRSMSYSIHFLVMVQYFLNALCTLLLIFTIKYFFQPGNKILYYLFAFLAIFSPLNMYLVNSVLSDSLFASLTVLWITSGLWILYTQGKATRIIIFTIHLILLFFLINVRYTGLVYLAITLLLAFISFYRRNILVYVILTALSISLIFGYYITQKTKVNKLVHVNTFSGFSGWQLANNALHCVPYIKISPSEMKDPRVKEFTKFVLQNDSLLILNYKPSAKFMWDNKLPLKKYCLQESKRTSTTFLYQWNYLGENVYKKFGSYIIRKHPIAFARYYLLPNLRLILYPSQDQIFKRYRSDGITSDLYKKWFSLAQKKVFNRSNIFENGFLLILMSRSILWLLTGAAIVFYMIKRNHIPWQSFQKTSFWLLVAFTAIYFAFSVYAGPFELRYIAPVHLVQISLIYMILNTFHST